MLELKVCATMLSFTNIFKWNQSSRKVPLKNKVTVTPAFKQLCFLNNCNTFREMYYFYVLSISDHQQGSWEFSRVLNPHCCATLIHYRQTVWEYPVRISNLSSKVSERKFSKAGGWMFLCPSPNSQVQILPSKVTILRKSGWAFGKWLDTGGTRYL